MTRTGAELCLCEMNPDAREDRNFDLFTLDRRVDFAAICGGKPL